MGAQIRNCMNPQMRYLTTRNQEMYGARLNHNIYIYIDILYCIHTKIIPRIKTAKNVLNIP